VKSVVVSYASILTYRRLLSTALMKKKRMFSQLN